MKIRCDSLSYDFTVAKIDGEIASDEFLIDFRFLKSNASEIETDIRRSFQIPRTSHQFASIMSDLLGDYEVPAAPKSHISEHFQFCLERLNRIHRRGVAVAVNLEVSSERAGVMQSRMVEGRRESGVRRRRRRVVDETAGTMAASKEAVEALERGRVAEDGEERECAICLERLGDGVEVIKMPCMHVYHNHCILRWLLKNHFCPFCRFKLPC